MKRYFTAISATFILAAGMGMAQAAPLSPQLAGEAVTTNANVIEARVCRTTKRRVCSPVRKCVTVLKKKKRVTTCTVRPQCRVIVNKICR